MRGSKPLFFIMILTIIKKTVKHIISIPFYWIVFVLILELIDYLLHRKP